MNFKNALSQYAIDSISNGLAPVTIQVYVNAIKKFSAFIGPETDINLITPQQVREFYAYLRVEHHGPRMDNPDKLSSASLHRYWKSLHSFFNWSHTEFDLDPPDKNLKSPKYSNKEILPYSKSEVQRLLSVCEYTAPIRRSTATYQYQFRLPDPLRNRAIIITLLDTGIRPSELCRLRLNNLKEDSHKIEVLPFIEGKTKTRTLEIQSITRTAILKYHQTCPHLEANDFMFAKINGGGLTKDALGRLFAGLVPERIFLIAAFIVFAILLPLNTCAMAAMFLPCSIFLGTAISRLRNNISVSQIKIVSMRTSWQVLSIIGNYLNLFSLMPPAKSTCQPKLLSRQA
jgi:integrase